MQLDRFLAGHVAPHRSPSREQREVGFATPVNQNDPGGKEKELEALSRAEGLEGIDLVDTRQRTMLATPEVLLPNFVEACESPDLFRQVLYRSQSAQGDLAPFLRQKLGLKPDADMTHVDGSSVNVDERREMMKEILTKHPEITLQCARNVSERISHHHELIAAIERKIEGALRKNFPVPKQQEMYMRASLPALEKLQGALEKVPSGALADLLGRLEQSKPELDERQIGEQLGVLKAGQAPDKIDDAAKTLIRFLVECKRAFHRQSTFGFGHWYEADDTPLDDAAYRQRQKDYLGSLQKQSEDLKKFLDAQLSDRAQSVVADHWKTTQDIMHAVKREDEQLTEEELNVRLLTRRNANGDNIAGYGAVALSDALDKHLHPLDDHGLLTPADKRRVKATDEKFLDYAAEVLPVLQERRKAGERDLERLLAQKRADQENIERWAHDTAMRLRRLHQLEDHKRRSVEKFLEHVGADPDTITQLHDLFKPYAFLVDDPQECERQLQVNPAQRITATDPEFPPTKRQAITALLDQCERNPDANFGTQAQHEVEGNRATLEGIDDAEILNQVRETRSQVGAVLRDIQSSPYVQHEVCKTLGVSGLLEKKNAHIQGMLFEIPGGKSDPDSLAILKRNLPLTQWEVRQLQQTADRLRGVSVVYEDLGEDNLGYFKDGLIHINSAKTQRKQEIARHHEEGHGALWALETAFPLLLSNHGDVLRERAPLLRELQDFHHYREIGKQTETWHDVARERLRQRSRDGTVDPRELEEETDRVTMEKMFNELLVRHAEWVHAGKKTEEKPSEERKKELLLFEELEKHRDAPDALDTSAIKAAAKFTSGNGGVLFLPENEDTREDAEAKQTGPQRLPEEPTGVNVHTELQEIKHEIEMVESFVDAYRTEFPEVEEDFRGAREDARTELKALANMFYKRQNGQVPEEDTELVRRVVHLRKFTKHLMEIIKKIDTQQLDISKETPKKKAGLFDGIVFISISDLVKLWSDLGEDLKSIYKRRQDRWLKDAGAGVTSALGVVGGKIPYYGEYFAGLRGYHDRRYSGTDVEAANKWQESMKFIDSHTVLDMLATTDDKDLLRGGISLLVERGEMDWNDDRVWRTFMRLTGYNMPIKACLRSDVLRDTWLRKMVNALWNDKEQYYHWRQGNDSHFDSHKKEFTPMADQLANVQGMAGELQKQLKLYVAWKEKYKQGIHEPMPDDVKPQLYEEVLHYAMRNGKMRMEDKFFYLIQAVRHGLLSIDRLRVMAGVGGEITLKFPFIDYFYQKNNTLPEVTRLGERLEEHGPDTDPFTPGAKTMLFLQLEMLREEMFRHRLSKALGRANIENIDHEDFPMIVAAVDWGFISEVTGLLSGDRYKITKESAKNSYVGFTTKFKAFSRLADMEREGLARFTAYDAREIATAVTSFLHMDNILTRKGLDKLARLSLTTNDYNSTGPSTDGMAVKEFRDSSYAFIHKLFEQLGDNFKWKATGVEKEEYLHALGVLDVRGPTVPDATQQKVFAAAPKVEEELKRALQAHTDTLKKVLNEQSDRSTRNYLMEQGASKEKEYLKKDVTTEYFKTLR